jgi:putative SOS response-associated peptidase YedK
MGPCPALAKDLKIGSRMINVRSEEAASKSAFRSALKRQRCLVPCTGFFEWKAVADEGSKKPKKQPYYIRRQDDGVFALAGLWERWHASDGALVESYSILTTKPNELVSSLHDRMPVIVRRDDYDFWLDPNMQDAERLRSIFAPFPADDLVANPVSTTVNSPAHDKPECIDETS